VAKQSEPAHARTIAASYYNVSSEPQAGLDPHCHLQCGGLSALLLQYYILCPTGARLPWFWSQSSSVFSLHTVLRLCPLAMSEIEFYVGLPLQVPGQPHLYLYLAIFLCLSTVLFLTLRSFFGDASCYHSISHPIFPTPWKGKHSQ
jgi:hypothetical protein